MKNFIYTTLLVFATLFCQAFGEQNEPPTIFDTTICVRKGDTIKVYEYEEQILQLLERREKEIWSGCCDMVSVELKDEPEIDAPDATRKELPIIKDWPAIIIKESTTFCLEVTYIRHLRCTNIPQRENDAKPGATLAMWHLFGKLLSNIDTARAVTKVSDTASIITMHKVKLKYQVGISFPEKVDFKITRINGDDDFCFDDDIIYLKIPDAYSACHLKWIVPDDVKPISQNMQNAYIESAITLWNKGTEYSYPIVCWAVSCSGDTTYSDTIKIGIPTPTPEMEDFACVAANATSFDVKVKESDGRLSYHWFVEDLAREVVVDTQQGASATMNIPKNEAVRLNLRSSGGCKDAEMEPMILHRSLVPEAHHIEMESEPLCIFEGDTLRFSLPEMPEDTLVWQIDNKEMLPPHDAYNYQALQDKDNVIVSVYAKSCPNDIITDTFNIREDFKVSLGAGPMCISANKDQVIKLASNGINPEVHWYGNGVKIDSTTYSTKDSISLRLINPGGQNLYVAVKARECGKDRKDSIPLRPLPEKPSWDTLWNGCIPLGIADTIELRVQSQEGVKFKWRPEEEAGKFWQIDQSDSNSTLVVASYKLEDRGRSISVSVSASVGGCGDSEPMTEVLYATGAGLGEEWHIDSKGNTTRRTVGFCQNSPDEIQNSRVELDSFAFLWTSNVKFNGRNTLQVLQFLKPTLPFDVACVLTNERTSCYSFYSKTIEESSTSQNIVSLPERTAQKNIGNEGISSMSYATFQIEEETHGGFLLAPNPTHGNTLLYMERTMVDKRAVIEILTEQGVCLYRQNVDADVVELPTARFRSGLYFVRVRVGDEDIIVRKLIVQQ